jgi:hypothetical protein
VCRRFISSYRAGESALELGDATELTRSFFSRYHALPGHVKVSAADATKSPHPHVIAGWFASSFAAPTRLTHSSCQSTCYTGSHCYNFTDPSSRASTL